MEVSYTNGGDKQIQRHKGRYASVPDVFTVFNLFFSFFLVYRFFQGFMRIGYMWAVRLMLTSVRLMDKAERRDKEQEMSQICFDSFGRVIIKSEL